MKCRTARELILLRVDETLSDSDSVALHLHMSSCIECRSYAQAADALLDATRASAEEISALLPSPEFDARLRRWLVQERDAQQNFARSGLYRLFSAPASVPTRALRVAAAAAAVFGAALYLNTLLSSTVHQTQAPALGRATSFVVRPAPDGRIYAALTDENTPGSSAIKRGYLP